MATWLTNGFPQKALRNGYSETREDILLRTSNAIGHENVRKRYSSSRKVINCSYLLTEADLTAWEAAWEDTNGFNYGAASITMPHPSKEATINARITPATYSINIVGHGIYTLSLTLETFT